MSFIFLFRLVSTVGVEETFVNHGTSIIFSIIQVVRFNKVSFQVNQPFNLSINFQIFLPISLCSHKNLGGGSFGF